jgi:hypothetical protein
MIDRRCVHRHAARDGAPRVSVHRPSYGRWAETRRLRGTPRTEPQRALTLSLAAGVDAPGRARQGVQRLRGVDDAVRPTLVLLLSEVVTNAVLRGGADAAGSIEVTITVGDVIRVEAAHGGDARDPAEPLPGAEETAHWSLVVVERLAARWGLEDGPPPLIWFEVPNTAAATAGPAVR